MSNRNNHSLTTGLAATLVVATVALLAACSQTHEEPAADAVTPGATPSLSGEALTSDLPEVVIVASREEPRKGG
jgi:hypothetical protein